MVKWNEVSAPITGDRKDIVRYAIQLGDNKVRLVGPVLPRYVYWVVTNEGKKAPVECLSFDREKQQFTSDKDPMKEIPAEIYSEKPQFAYVSNIIDRKDSAIKLFDIKQTIFKEIVKIAQDKEYGDPSDPVSGCDITISKEKTGPLTQNVKYSIRPGRNTTPLSAEELEKLKAIYDLSAIFKRPTYTEQKEWLVKNTPYFATAVGNELREGVQDIE